MDSILTDIKHMLGIEEDYESFDTEIILHINSVFFILYQLGVTDKPFKIQNKTAKWEDFVNNINDLEIIKSYMYLKCRLLFDPPQQGTVMDSFQRLIAEFESRISYSVDPENTFSKG